MTLLYMCLPKEKLYYYVEVLVAMNLLFRTGLKETTPSDVLPQLVIEFSGFYVGKQL